MNKPIINEKPKDDFPGLIRMLRIPIPDDLETLIGYLSDRRYLAIWWQSEDDEMCYCDGDETRTDGIWAPWYSYITHPKMRKYFKPYSLGIHTTIPDHFLLLDRKHRRLYVGDENHVMEFVYSHAEIRFPKPDDTEVSKLVDMGSPLENMQNWLAALPG